VQIEKKKNTHTIDKQNKSCS